MEGATAGYYLGWSPDRRNHLFNGTVQGRYGTFMLSALGVPSPVTFTRWGTTG